MKKLNRRGYMTIEIILASVITFVIAFFLIDLTIKLVNTTDDAYADIVLTTDKALIVKNIRENIKRDMSINGNIEAVSCEKTKCTITMNNGVETKLSVSENVITYIDSSGNKTYSKKIDNSLSDITISSSNNDSNEYYNFKISGTNIFLEEDYDMNVFVYNKASPILAPNNNWYKGKTKKTEITVIEFVDSYSPPSTANITEMWNAAANVADLSDTEVNNNEIKCYIINGNRLIISGNGTGVIYANPDSSLFFGSDLYDYDDREIDFTTTFSSLEEIKGIKLLDTSMVKNMYRMFYGCKDLKELDLSNFKTSNVTNMSSMFAGCESIISLIFNKDFDTSKVTKMVTMFADCKNLIELNLSNLNTEKVEDMSGMFQGCESLTKITFGNKFITSNVTKMPYMFNKCHNLTELNLSHFDTSNVTNMCSMFLNCFNLKALNVSSFDTSNVTNMVGMFAGCSELEELNLFNFNTSNVINMGAMFSHCEKLKELDLSSFNIEKVEYFSEVANWSENNPSNERNVGMFMDCSNLEKIYVSDQWDISNDSSSDNMFLNCANLKGGAGTTYNSNFVNAIYAKVDGKDGEPGYLTLK